MALSKKRHNSLSALGVFLPRRVDDNGWDLLFEKSQ